MGQTESTPLGTTKRNNEPITSSAVKQDAEIDADAGIKNETAQLKPLNRADLSGCPVETKSDKKCTHTSPPNNSNGCALKATDSGPKIYNVYAEEIDPKNLMPQNPNQEPHPNQKYPIDTSRVESNIPKGGTEGTWLYPSPQMFYNALQRKGKGEDVDEVDAETLVAIHNNMNERTWTQVKEWETTLHPDSHPKLHRFMGKPDEYSPLARVKYLLGPLPFDRHDWYILRSDGSEVRYIIDYYHDEDKGRLDEVPELGSQDKIRSIDMVVRPALDGPRSFLDRLRFSLSKGLGRNYPLPAPESVPSSSTPETISAADIEEMSEEQVTQMHKMVEENCQSFMLATKTCKDDDDCAQAAAKLTMCVSGIICAREATKLKQALQENNDEAFLESQESISECLDRFEMASRKVLMAQAKRQAKQKFVGKE